jgi:predicted nucleic-acid-binding protein
MRALDTNVLVRFFVDDADDAQAARQRPAAVAALAERFLRRAQLLTAPAVRPDTM